MTYKRVDYSRDEDLMMSEELMDLGEARAVAKEITKNPSSAESLLNDLSENEYDTVVLQLEDKGYWVDPDTNVVSKLEM